MTFAEKFLKKKSVGRDLLDEFKLRGEYVKKFGFAILVPDTVEKLKKYSPILEVGAGSGYWAMELQKAGIDVIATDPRAGDSEYSKRWNIPYLEIEKLTGVKAVKKYLYRNLLMVWPCYNRPWAYQTLIDFRGKYFIYVGEGDGGCTADDKFHEYLESDFQEVEKIHIPQFNAIHDYLAVFERREK